MMRTSFRKFRRRIGDRRGDDYILTSAFEFNGGQPSQLKKMLGDENFDAILVGYGDPARPRARNSGRKEAYAISHRHRLALERVVRPHAKIGKRVIVLGGGNTAMAA